MRTGTKRKSLSKNNGEEARGTKGEVPEMADFVHNYNAGNIEVQRHDMIMIGQRGLLMNMRICIRLVLTWFALDADPRILDGDEDREIGGSVKFTATCFATAKTRSSGYPSISRDGIAAIWFPESEIPGDRG
jgi:hypothetical protein